MTVFTRPFPCPGQCIFCPNDVRMPKSYLSDEPGAQRAEDNGFHPYTQTWGRIDVLRALGHAVSKIEILILGGTWTHYPPPYRRWFVCECFKALNDFGKGIDRRNEVLEQHLQLGNTPRIPHTGVREGHYNRALRTHLGPFITSPQAFESASFEEITWTQHENVESPCRSVGLVIETRPDEITLAQLIELRKLGVTKVQLGVQSLSDTVLTQNKRGHDVQTTKRAFAKLRSMGFKIMAHAMPNLLGATPESDLVD
ncbi:MAG: radical SAM protein, partial [Myxococcota bacterium]